MCEVCNACVMYVSVCLCVYTYVCLDNIDRFGNEIAGVEELGTTGRGGDMQVCCCHCNRVMSLSINPSSTDWYLCGKNVPI